MSIFWLVVEGDCCTQNGSWSSFGKKKTKKLAKVTLLRRLSPGLPSSKSCRSI